VDEPENKSKKLMSLVSTKSGRLSTAMQFQESEYLNETQKMMQILSPFIVVNAQPLETV